MLDTPRLGDKRDPEGGCSSNYITSVPDALLKGAFTNIFSSHFKGVPYLS